MSVQSEKSLSEGVAEREGVWSALGAALERQGWPTVLRGDDIAWFWAQVAQAVLCEIASDYDTRYNARSFWRHLDLVLSGRRT